MNREKLVGTLEFVSRALGKSTMTQIFNNFCFQDKTVYAFNDEIGIQADCEVDGEFGLHGQTLLNLLKTMTGETVEFQKISDYEIKITSGKTHLVMPFVTSESFTFHPPTDGWEETLYPSADFLEGLKLCLVTSSQDQAMPALMGIYLEVDNDLTLYSCDSDAITRFISKESFESVNPTPKRYFLSNAFCTTLLRLSSSVEPVTLTIGPEWAGAVAKTWSLWGRMAEPGTINHAKLIKDTVKTPPSFVPITPSFKEALRRAEALTLEEPVKTTLTIKNGKVSLLTQAKMGTVEDSVVLKGHADVIANVSSGLLVRSLGVTSEISIAENCCVFTQGAELFVLISNMD